MYKQKTQRSRGVEKICKKTLRCPYDKNVMEMACSDSEHSKLLCDEFFFFLFCIKNLPLFGAVSVKKISWLLLEIDIVVE